MTYRLTADERDRLYERNINPIAKFPNEGIVAFGQKTLQAKMSALDRINVRRLLIYVKRQIRIIANSILFQPNVEATWRQFRRKATAVLSDIQAQFGITDFAVVLDSTTTTPDDVDRNFLYAKIFLQPTRAIEFIQVDFIVTRTGVEFT